jgi:hypothetical protein
MEDAGTPSDTVPVATSDAAPLVPIPATDRDPRKPPKPPRDRDRNKPTKPVVAVTPPTNPVDRPPPPEPPVVKPKDPIKPVAPPPVVVTPKDPPKPVVVKPKVPTSFKAGITVLRFDSQGPLSKRVTRKALASRAEAALLACYEPAARANKKNSGVSIGVKFEINEVGRAQGIAVTPGKRLPGVASCVKRAVKKIRVKSPPDTGTQTIRFVVKYTPKQ